ncbi:hypothetical protein GCK72_022425 [Caenorhabditis remanei]|uniref:DUF38 domain-containing protein n=1 Tax=Caenorhabditis remanei TaxID=31234 RepID=A0A6A5FU03_CAERE|nr:hypothetical protein GCK72_022425 [Caenorhabditis remanei]KAF1745975.1 hypothetical protein GCK72_022425 [Caenorhabditis remanei]
MELPADFLPKVAPFLGYVDRVNLSKVNRALQDEVKSWKPEVKYIEVQCNQNRSIMTLDGIQVHYENVVQPGGRPTTTCKVTHVGRRSKMLQNANQLDLILSDVETVLRNPKAQLEKFEVFSTTGFEQKIIEKLGLLVPQIEAKSVNLTMHCSAGQETILSSFQSGVLESLVLNDMNCPGIDCGSHINLVTGLEQCQRAKRVTIFTHSLRPANFKLENLTGVEILDMKFQREHLTMSIATAENWLNILRQETSDLPVFKVEVPFDFQLQDFVRHMRNVTGLAVQHHGNMCGLNIAAKPHDYLEMILQLTPHALYGTLRITRKLRVRA